MGSFLDAWVFLFSDLSNIVQLWEDYTTATAREGSATDLKFSVMFVVKMKALV